jgi:hypothetical protein
MKNLRTIICAMCVMMALITVRGFANMYLQDGGTWNITTAIYDSIYVDVITSGNPTTVNILEGADFPNWNSQFLSYNNARINILGGFMRDFRAYDNSIVKMSGGSVVEITAYGHSNITISGGSIGLDGYGLNAIDNSTVALDGYDFELGSGLMWGVDGNKILGSGVLTGKWFDETSFTIDIQKNY